MAGLQVITEAPRAGDAQPPSRGSVPEPLGSDQPGPRSLWPQTIQAPDQSGPRYPEASRCLGSVPRRAFALRSSDHPGLRLARPQINRDPGTQRPPDARVQCRGGHSLREAPISQGPDHSGPRPSRPQINRGPGTRRPPDARVQCREGHSLREAPIRVGVGASAGIPIRRRSARVRENASFPSALSARPSTPAGRSRVPEAGGWPRNGRF